MSDLTETDFPPLEPQPFVTEEGREIERLRAELAAMRQQRDAARREACLWALPQGVVWNEAMIARAKAIAAERGWDCFAQQERGGA